MSSPGYPRPQLVREEWRSLDGTWRFAWDPEDVGLDAGWATDDSPFDREIMVPFPPESERSDVQEDGCEVMWYRLELEAAVPPAGRRLHLHFEGVDYSSTVWLNGERLGEHEGGQTRFSFDATSALLPVGPNVLVVRAKDEVANLEQPRGKQDWMPDPHVIWYHRTSGIWRSVWLEETAATFLSAVTWLPAETPGVVDAEIRLAGVAPKDAEVTLEFSHEGRLLARTRHAVQGSVLRTSIRLDDDRFHIEPEVLSWTPESPTLIDVRVALDDGGQRVEEVRSYLGVRTTGVDDRSFLLNGRPYFLRLVLEQGYWPATHLAAPSDDELRREVELIKSLGFNGIRVHQKVADPRFLYWCDRLGLLVWADAAASYRFSALALARTTREWISIVERDISHPSIVAWVPFNESWGVPHLDAEQRQRWAVVGLHGLIKALDPSRVVLGNDGWEYVVGDLVGVHDYSHNPEVLRERYGDSDAVALTVADGRSGGRRISLESQPVRRPVVLSEFGGFNLAAEDDAWEGYGSAASPEQLLERLKELFAPVGEDSGLAGFCYTQLTDTLQEQNGLLTAERGFKVPPEAVAEIIRGRG